MGLFSSIGKILKVVVSIGLIVVGVITGNVALIAAGASMLLSSLFAPKAPARPASEASLQLGEQARAAIFGEYAIAGSLVDAFNYGGKYGTDWEVLVIRLADHICDSLVGYYVNDEYHAYSGNGFPAGFDSSFQIYFRSDTSTQAVPSILTSHGPGWTSNDKGRSGCDVVVAYKADKPDEKHPEWPGGRPRFMFVVKGKKCYDPRLDSTVAGGSGSHRWDDPATWAWSDNPAVCRYNWVRGIYAEDAVGDPSALLIGRGLTAVEAPPENLFAPANLCDEIVDGEKRYRIGGQILSDTPYLETEEAFALACGGSIVTREGSVEMEPGQAKSVVASFTDADLLVGSEVEFNQDILSESDQEWVNTVVARYVEPAQKWSAHAAPVRRDTADIVADGRPREATLDLKLVRHVKQASRVAEIARRFGRLWGRASVKLGPRFCFLEDGDWVNWTSDRLFGGATRTFRVDVYSIDEKWQVALQLRQINSTVFSEGAFIEDQAEANPNDVPGNIGTPDSGNWALTTVLLTGGGASIPAIVISGDASDDPAAQQVRFEYWPDDGVIDPVANPDDPDWANAGTFGPGVTRREITSIVSGADYYAAVSYLVQGIPGERLVLGPVTAGVIDVSGQLQTMADMPNVVVDADYTGAPLTGELPLTIQARRYSGGVEVTNSATWSVTVDSGAITITDLTPSDGTIEVTALGATAQLTVTSTYNGIALNKVQVVELRLAAPPAGTSFTASDNALDGIASATMAAISDELTVTVGASGTVSLTAPLTVKTAKSSPAATYEVLGRWQWWNGASWTDLGGSDTASDPDCEVFDANGGDTPTVWMVNAGTLNVAASKSSLTPGASEKFRLRAKNASGTRPMTFTGTATAMSS